METAKIKELVSKMNSGGEASLCSGLDFWHTKEWNVSESLRKWYQTDLTDSASRTIKQTIWESTTAFRLFAFQRDVQPHPALTVSW